MGDEQLGRGLWTSKAENAPDANGARAAAQSFWHSAEDSAMIRHMNAASIPHFALGNAERALLLLPPA